MTFDNVPWVITMKKNEHYFPTVEWIKDGSATCGWRRLTYRENGRPIEGEPDEGLTSMQPGDGGDVGDDDMGDY